MSYPKWCKPKKYHKGIRIEITNWNDEHNGKKGTLSNFADGNDDGLDCYYVDWDNDKEFHKGDMWYIGFLKIINPTLKSLVED
jgi:hypothetical protein